MGDCGPFGGGVVSGMGREDTVDHGTRGIEITDFMSLLEIEQNLCIDVLYFQYYMFYTDMCLLRVSGWLRSTCLSALSTSDPSSGRTGSVRIYIRVREHYVSPYNGTGSPDYTGFKTCWEFYRSHGLLDWTILIFEWK